MRMRIKFSKAEPLQYIGHLDVMRYFQKAIRRAGLPVRYSEGFSPHILMSFASPLGVGKVSRGEYFDLEMDQALPSEEVVRKLHEQMVPGLDVLAAAQVSDSKKENGMRVIAAASYEIGFPPPEPALSHKDLEAFMAQKEIRITRKTKKKEEQVDIRPWIHALTLSGGALHMCLASGSANNLKPELVLEALSQFVGTVFADAKPRICRTELYAERTDDVQGDLVPLLERGRADGDEEA